MVELIGVPITRIGIYTCNACIVKSTNGSIENRGIQSNQDVHVYGIRWMGVVVVFVANFYF